MEKSKIKIIVQASICVVLVCLIWAGYYVARKKINKNIELCKDDFSWVYQVDSTEIKDDEFIMKGFAFQLEQDAVGDDFEIVLNDLETGKNIFLKMNYYEREDVNDYFLCEYDYLQSGFEARIEKKDIQEKEYEVLLRMLGKKKAYQTGIYLTKGQLVYANPREFVALEVSETGLEEVVDKGRLRVHRPDFGMYVYQYEGDLYWIADEKYEFSADGNTMIQWHLETTQIERLPIERLKNKWYIDNLSFMFSKMELKDSSVGKYRVAKCPLPTEYSIIYMNTGKHVEKWVWEEEFRPFYEFDK